MLIAENIRGLFDMFVEFCCKIFINNQICFIFGWIGDVPYIYTWRNWYRPRMLQTWNIGNHSNPFSWCCRAPIFPRSGGITMQKKHTYKRRKPAPIVQTLVYRHDLVSVKHCYFCSFRYVYSSFQCITLLLEFNVMSDLKLRPITKFSIGLGKTHKQTTQMNKESKPWRPCSLSFVYK